MPNMFIVRCMAAYLKLLLHLQIRQVDLKRAQGLKTVINQLITARCSYGISFMGNGLDFCAETKLDDQAVPFPQRYFDFLQK